MIAFPDRRCANPNCKTPDKLLEPHEQFGPDLQHPVCLTCLHEVEGMLAQMALLQKTLYGESYGDDDEWAPYPSERRKLEGELLDLEDKLAALQAVPATWVAAGF